MIQAFTGTRTITSIDVHAEGEVGRVLPGAHLLVRGTTWSERMRWCERELHWLRRLVLREPRGHPSMCGVLVLPALDPTADIGIIILEQGGFRPMSGATLTCAVTALLETGSLPATEPETVVRVDTAVGAVEATARVEGGRVSDPCQLRALRTVGVGLDQGRSAQPRRRVEARRRHGVGQRPPRARNEVPWGGFKGSGYGRDLSIYALDDYSRTKHVMHNVAR